MISDELEAKKLANCPCKQVAYCGKKCQKEDWRYHKKICTMAKKSAKETNSKEIAAEETDSKNSDTKKSDLKET
jgi:hypothetical protein